jgi:hypothetical protein
MSIQVDENGEIIATIDNRDAELLKEFRDQITVTAIARENLSKDGTWLRIERLIDQGLMMAEQGIGNGVVSVQTSPSGLRFRRQWLRDAPKRAMAQEQETRDAEARRQGYIDESLF